MAETQWVFERLTERQQEQFKQLRQNPKLNSIPNISLEYLIRRGYTDEATILKLFYQDLSQLHEVSALQDGQLALNLIEQAIRNQKNIVVYSDYDADGCGGAAAAVEGLRYLGARVMPFTNNRFEEGYGINVKGLTRLFNTYPKIDMIITVDNGIVAYEGVELAKSKGIQVVVTDHHEPASDGSLPCADAVVNAKRIGSQYPFRELCGAGLIFKLLCGLAKQMNRPLQGIYNTLDLVGLSTVGDMVPLIDENRVIVRESLRLAETETRPFFRILKEMTKSKKVTEETYGYHYAPLVNAIGRITGNVDVVIAAMISHDEDFVRRAVSYMIQVNDERKRLTEIQETEAFKMIAQQGEQPIYILTHREFHEGIVGLVAGRLKEYVYRPVLVLKEEEEIEILPNGTKQVKVKLKGSARSIEGFHLKQVLDECSEYLEGYGGHAAAAGLTVKGECLEAFKTTLIQKATERLTPDLLTPKLNIDFILQPNQLTVGLIDELETLKPFGVGFEKCIIALTNFKTQSQRYMGTTQKHLKLSEPHCELVAFNYALQYREMGEPRELEAIGFPDVNVWNGRTTIQFLANEIKPLNQPNIQYH